MDTLASQSFWTGLAAIVGINLVLAGDNAIVIAMAARSLPPKMQRKAILLGTVAAVILRIVLTAAVVALLQVPFLKFVGGVMLLWIAFRLGTQDEDEHPDQLDSGELRAAVMTILMADLVMSLDNVLAVAAAADGSYLLIVLGLAISIPIVMGGAAVLLGLIKRFPVLVWIGVALIAYTGMELIQSDRIIREHVLVELSLTAHVVRLSFSVAMTAAITAIGLLHVRHNKTKAELKP